MNKVILINLPVGKEQLDERNYNPPIGLLYLGTVLELNGYESIILDLWRKPMEMNQIISIIYDNNPVLIGISTYTVNINDALALSKSIKRFCPDVKIVLGGPHASLDFEYGMNSKFIDFTIRKEGEPTILELAEAIATNEELIKFDDIPGLVFKRDGNIIKNSIRKSITDLDIMPLLKREIVDENEYNGYINISSSRGCPENCVYCAGTVLHGKAYRIRSITNVFLEVVMIKTVFSERVTGFYFIDDTFTVMPERVYEFIRLKNYYGYQIAWFCESRVDVMTEELINKMAEGGCISIHYGIESGNQEVLNKIRKNIDLNHARKVIEYTHNAGMLICLYFILGHFCDTKETMEQTIDFLKEMCIKFDADNSLFLNVPLHGTWQHTHMKELGLRFTSEDYSKHMLYSAVVESNNFTSQDLVELFHKASPYLLKHNFGY